MSANLRKYGNAFYMSQLLLNTIQADEFPISVNKIINNKSHGSKILISSLNDFIGWNKLMNPASWRAPNIRDARCYYYNSIDTYIIVYNEQQSKNRIRFSLAHELAHIVLGHLTDSMTEISRGGLDDPTYYAMEGAANTFAGNFLAPPILIKERLNGKPFNINDIAAFFKLSSSAVRGYRLEDYNQWRLTKPSKHEKAILLRCASRMHPKRCARCNNFFYDRDAKFCPICGCHFLYDFKGDKTMKYSSIIVDENGRAKECPHCQNSEVNYEGNYCVICGVELVNRCTDTNYQDDNEGWYTRRSCEKGQHLPGNARFCPYCGNKTTFEQSGVLKDWKIELQDKEDEIPNDDFPPF